jgi:hypothetical protein
LNSWNPARRHPSRPNRPQPMRLPNRYPTQRPLLRCDSPPTVPSGGANAVNVVGRRANTREQTPLEVDRSPRRSCSLGAAAEIVPNCPLRLPSPKRTALTLLAARLIRPKNGFASGIGTGFVHGSIYPDGGPFLPTRAPAEACLEASRRTQASGDRVGPARRAASENRYVFGEMPAPRSRRK